MYLSIACAFIFGYIKMKVVISVITQILYFQLCLCILLLNKNDYFSFNHPLTSGLKQKIRTLPSNYLTFIN